MSSIEQEIGVPKHFVTNDGVKLKYTDTGPQDGIPVVFIHGWSANGSYFRRNIPNLVSEGMRCITVDHRGMGDSEKPGHGFRVSRLAADINDLLNHLNLPKKPILCGSSLGFTIISIYLENYGQENIAGVCFVDQSCSMYHRPGWYTGMCRVLQSVCVSNFEGAPEISNPAMCTELISTLKHDFENLSYNIIENGFGEVNPTEEEKTFLKEQILKCDTIALGQIMQDHANLDLRDLMPKIKIPVLNCIGGSTRCHHIPGIAYIGNAVQHGRNIMFAKCGHFLYFEAPDLFNKCLIQFVKACNEANRPSEVMKMLAEGPCEELKFLDVEIVD